MNRNEIDLVKSLFDKTHQDLVSYYVDIDDRTRDKSQSKVRTIAPNEIVIEFDTDDTTRVDLLIRRTIKRLQKNQISYFMFNHGGRSPHIHIIDVSGLELLDTALITQYKKTFIEIYCSVWDCVYPEVDLSLTTNSHIIAREFYPHFKHNNIKELVDYQVFNNRGKLNRIDIRILKKAEERNEFYQKLNNRNYEDRTNYNWFLNWIKNEELGIGDRDILIYKNLAIYCENNKIDVEPYISVIQRYDFSVGREVRGWLKWAKSSKKFFNIKEVERYCENHDLDISELMTKWA